MPIGLTLRNSVTKANLHLPTATRLIHKLLWGVTQVGFVMTIEHVLKQLEVPVDRPSWEASLLDCLSSEAGASQLIRPKMQLQNEPAMFVSPLRKIAR